MAVTSLLLINNSNLILKLKKDKTSNIADRRADHAVLYSKNTNFFSYKNKEIAEHKMRSTMWTFWC